MKIKLLGSIIVLTIAVLFPCISFSQGHLIDENIILPTPQTGQQGAVSAQFNSTNGTYYVSGLNGKCLIECDGATDMPINRILINFSANNVIINPNNNKLYAFKDHGDSIVVIDCYTNNIIKYLTVSDTTMSGQVTLNPNDNKVYCGGYENLFIIDSETDKIQEEIVIGNWVSSLTFNSVENKIYACTFSHNLFVIDGTTNIILKILDVNNIYTVSCFNPVNNKVYCSGSNDVAITIDCVADTILNHIYAPAYLKELVYNPESNKIYGAYGGGGDGGIAIVNGETNEVVIIPIDEGISNLSYNPANNTVYATPFPEAYMYILNGITDQIDGIIPLDHYYYSSIFNPISKSMVLLYWNSSQLIIVDAVNNVQEKLVPLGMQPENLCYCSTYQKLYINDAFSNLLSIVDATTNKGIKYIYMDSRGGEMVYAPGSEKIYVTHPNINKISVIDCINDEIIGMIDIENISNGLSYCSSNNSLYCSVNDNYILSVISCANDQITENITLSLPPWSLFYNDVNNQLYVNHRLANEMTIIDCTDNSINSNIDVVGGWVSMEFAKTTNTLYVCNKDDGKLSVVNCTNNTTELFDLPIPYHMVDMAYNSVNNKLYFVNPVLNEVVIVECDEYSVIKTIHIENGAPNYISYEPIKNVIIVCDSPYEFPSRIHEIDGESNNLLQSTVCGSLFSDIIYDSELQKTFVASRLSSRLYVINDSIPLSTPEYFTSLNSSFGLKVFPNPCTTNATLNYQLPNSGYVEIDLLDISGKLINNILTGNQKKGSQELQFACGGLPAGNYFIRIRCCGSSEEKKLIIVTE